MRSKESIYLGGTGAASLLQGQSAPTHHIDGSFILKQHSNDSKKILHSTRNKEEKSKNLKGNHNFNAKGQKFLKDKIIDGKQRKYTNKG